MIFKHSQISQYFFIKFINDFQGENGRETNHDIMVPREVCGAKAGDEYRYEVEQYRHRGRGLQWKRHFHGISFRSLLILRLKVCTYVQIRNAINLKIMLRIPIFVIMKL